MKASPNKLEMLKMKFIFQEHGDNCILCFPYPSWNVGHH